MYSDSVDISLLDFGCGSGRDTKYFLQKGFNVDAIDGCEELCKAASEFAGIEVKQALFQKWKAEKDYEGIWACLSILHLSKQDLAEVSEEELLKTWKEFFERNSNWKDLGGG